MDPVNSEVRISDTANKATPTDVGGIRRKHKQKKKKLVVGSLCSQAMTSQGDFTYLGDEVKAMEAIGDQIRYSFRPNANRGIARSY
ncbi:hypothetical protein Tco_1334693 [Tanacetum coccineum]